MLNKEALHAHACHLSAIAYRVFPTKGPGSLIRKIGFLGPQIENQIRDWSLIRKMNIPSEISQPHFFIIILLYYYVFFFGKRIKVYNNHFEKIK